jgi:hypothetical protein
MSGLSGMSGIAGSASAPAAPTGLAGTGGALQVAFTWNTLPVGSTASLYQGSSPGGESATPVATGLTGTSYTLTGLSSGTLYYFYIKAVKGSGTSPASNEVSAYTNSSLLTGSQAYYAMEVLTTDSTGNGNTLTNNNGVTQAAGKIGQAALVAVAGSKYLSRGTFSYSPTVTMSCWIKPNAWPAGNDLIGDASSSGLSGWEIGSVGGDATKVVINVGGSNTGTTPTGAVPDGVFTHLAMVIDGTQASNATRLVVYINGSPVSLTFSGTIPATIPYVSTEFDVGSTKGGSFGFNGLIDELGIWNVALISSQITRLYNAGAGITYPFQGIP